MLTYAFTWSLGHTVRTASKIDRSHQVADVEAQIVVLLGAGELKEA